MVFACELLRMVTHYANDIWKVQRVVYKGIVLEPINVIYKLEPEQTIRECEWTALIVRRQLLAG